MPKHNFAFSIFVCTCLPQFSIWRVSEKVNCVPCNTTVLSIPSFLFLVNRTISILRGFIVRLRAFCENVAKLPKFLCQQDGNVICVHYNVVARVVWYVYKTFRVGTPLYAYGTTYCDVAFVELL